MEKTTEEKIDEMHDIMLMLRADLTAFKESCRVRHETLNVTIDDHNKDLYGNGKPGIIDRFNKFENRAIGYTIAAMMVMQIIGPKIVKALGW